MKGRRISLIGLVLQRKKLADDFVEKRKKDYGFNL